MRSRYRLLILPAAGFVWALAGYYFTLKLDDWGVRLAESWGATDGIALAAVAGLPWIGHMLALLAIGLIWVVANPAWHPWRDTFFAGAVAAVATAGAFGVAVWRGHVEREGVSSWLGAAVVAGMAVATAVALCVPFAIVAANRIWATPQPKRHERFGPPE